MPSYRCSLCGINYPPRIQTNKCPVHHEQLTYANVDPDEDWAERSAILQEHLAPAEPEPLDAMIPLVEAKVIIRPGGAYFVSSWDVYDAVRGRLRPGDLIRIGKQTFEILEYLEEPRQYWVRPFATELREDDLARLAGV